MKRTITEHAASLQAVRRRRRIGHLRLGRRVRIDFHRLSSFLCGCPRATNVCRGPGPRIARSLMETTQQPEGENCREQIERAVIPMNHRP